MLRKILFHLLPFLLPFIAYGLYLFATRRARQKGQAFDEAPWYWLFASGMLLLVISLVAVWFFSGDPAGGEYVAPHMQDGEMVPGKFN
ncbi:MAG: hypothetical protein HOK21_12585 [Rhodospirillaceae bacterium]|jgi:hypothetical protein|nr:hypothetical protein [Rhodospirillaceae bacterium]MBT4686913.1 hypothetical protein [Rhodospirillaceae bacterium]MBT5081841.1 hypothetical protein [Rhodospirillaceae bacterium]MBT5524921.1 hypothetical protein [Rhodospirillaceae bacterium]MBT5881386.1 hypothetical protein [Rhodospirillaceae bacterium]